MFMNWYSFLGQEYSFFNVIVSCLIALKILKRQNILPPEIPLRLYPRSQAAITIALQLLFPL